MANDCTNQSTNGYNLFIHGKSFQTLDHGGLFKDNDGNYTDKVNRLSLKNLHKIIRDLADYHEKYNKEYTDSTIDNCGSHTVTEDKCNNHSLDYFDGSKNEIAGRLSLKNIKKLQTKVFSDGQLGSFCSSEIDSPCYCHGNTCTSYADYDKLPDDMSAGLTFRGIKDTCPSVRIGCGCYEYNNYAKLKNVSLCTCNADVIYGCNSNIVLMCTAKSSCNSNTTCNCEDNCTSVSATREQDCTSNCSANDDTCPSNCNPHSDERVCSSNGISDDCPANVVTPINCTCNTRTGGCDCHQNVTPITVPCTCYGQTPLDCLCNGESLEETCSSHKDTNCTTVTIGCTSHCYSHTASCPANCNPYNSVISCDSNCNPHNSSCSNNCSSVTNEYYTDCGNNCGSGHVGCHCVSDTTCHTYSACSCDSKYCSGNYDCSCVRVEISCSGNSCSCNTDKCTGCSCKGEVNPNIECTVYVCCTCNDRTACTCESDTSCGAYSSCTCNGGVSDEWHSCNCHSGHSATCGCNEHKNTKPCTTNGVTNPCPCNTLGAGCPSDTTEHCTVVSACSCHTQKYNCPSNTDCSLVAPPCTCEEETSSPEPYNRCICVENFKSVCTGYVNFNSCDSNCSLNCESQVSGCPSKASTDGCNCVNKAACSSETSACTSQGCVSVSECPNNIDKKVCPSETCVADITTCTCVTDGMYVDGPSECTCVKDLTKPCSSELESCTSKNITCPNESSI